MLLDIESDYFRTNFNALSIFHEIETRFNTGCNLNVLDIENVNHSIFLKSN